MALRCPKCGKEEIERIHFPPKVVVVFECLFTIEFEETLTDEEVMQMLGDRFAIMNWIRRGLYERFGGS